MMPISAVLVRGKFALVTFGPGRASKYIYDADDGLVTVRPVLDPLPHFGELPSMADHQDFGTPPA
jgi:hypothetical protein